MLLCARSRRLIMSAVESGWRRRRARISTVGATPRMLASDWRGTLPGKERAEVRGREWGHVVERAAPPAAGTPRVS